jgi:serine/threonine protein kinase
MVWYARGSIVAQGASEFEPSETTERIPSPDRSEAGRTIGPYLLVQELGRGGQGRVFLAEDARLRRPVALKVLAAWAGMSSDVLLRFQREAEITSKLDHPGVCPVNDAGFDGPFPYSAMRYVEGETLAAKLARARDSKEDPGVLHMEISETARPAQAPEPVRDASISGPTERAEFRDTIRLIEEVARASHRA